MTYRFTMTVPDSEPIIQEGEFTSGDLLLGIKVLFWRFMFEHRDVTWTNVAIEFINE